jgi:hypothetical protein
LCRTWKEAAIFALDCLSSSDADKMGISSVLLPQFKSDRSVNELKLLPCKLQMFSEKDEELPIF